MDLASWSGVPERMGTPDRCGSPPHTFQRLQEGHPDLEGQTFNPTPRVGKSSPNGGASAGLPSTTRHFQRTHEGRGVGEGVAP